MHIMNGMMMDDLNSCYLTWSSRCIDEEASNIEKVMDYFCYEPGIFGRHQGKKFFFRRFEVKKWVCV